MGHRQHTSSMTRVAWPLRGLAALFCVALALPFLAAVTHLPQADWGGIDRPSLLRATATSLASASLATALVAAGGVPLGYWLARRRLDWLARGIGALVQLPLALPPLASGVLLLFLFGPVAPLPWLIGSVTDSFIGIVIAEAFVAAPFLVIAARSAFAALDPALEDVAATLGHSALARFRHVALSAAWPGIRAGLILCWLRAFGEFGATMMLAYHPYTLPVYTYVAFGISGLPAMLPVLLPTLVTAVSMLSLAALPSAPSSTRRRRPSPDRPAPGDFTVQAPGPRPPSRPRPTASRLRFAVRHQRPGFRLNAAWAPSASRLAILGPSGAGKSLLLRMLAGLEPHGHGELAVDGRAIQFLPPERRGIAYVPQAPSLLPGRRLRDQVLFPVGAEPSRAGYWIGRLGLAGLEDRRPDELSAGQRQRVALARALTRPAQLLLLDEPFSALDTGLRGDLQLFVRDLQREAGLITLLVTHDPIEARRLADEILLIDNGHVLQYGAYDDLFLRPVSERAARLLGASFGCPGWTDGRHLRLPDGTSLLVAGPALPRGAVTWSVAAHRVRITGETGYPAQITWMDGTELVLALGGVTLPYLLSPGQSARPGPCRVEIPPDAIQVWPTAGGSGQ